MKVEEVPIKLLKPAEYNPRAMTEKEASDLRKSLEKFGMVEPIVVNRAPGRENVIVGGHQRYYLLKEMGRTTIPVVYVNIPNIEDEKELNLRLNKNLGHWDWDELANFDELQLVDVGFENEELDEIFGLEQAEEFRLETELKKVLRGKERRVKDGDLWQLGEHKLIIGDCTKRENWEKLLKNERFDFMFTDPPYKLAYFKKRVRKVKTKEGFKIKKEREYPSVGETDSEGRPKITGEKQTRGVPEYDEWLSIANEFQNPQGANVMIFESWKNTVALWQAMEKYWRIRNMIIWWLPNRHQGFSSQYTFYNKYDIAPLADKGKVVLNEEYEEELDNYLKEKGQKLLDSYEIIVYGNKNKPAWNKAKGTRYWMIGDHISWNTDSESYSGQNVVFGTKPTQILVPYIKILSPRGGIVAEPFAGSGSTIIACEIMRRRCRAIEIDPTYGEVILARWEKFTGKEAKKIEEI